MTRPQATLPSARVNFWSRAESHLHLIRILFSLSISPQLSVCIIVKSSSLQSIKRPSSVHPSFLRSGHLWSIPLLFSQFIKRPSSISLSSRQLVYQTSFFSSQSFFRQFINCPSSVGLPSVLYRSIASLFNQSIGHPFISFSLPFLSSQSTRTFIIFTQFSNVLLWSIIRVFLFTSSHAFL